MRKYINESYNGNRRKGAEKILQLVHSYAGRTHTRQTQEGFVCVAFIIIGRKERALT